MEQINKIEIQGHVGNASVTKIGDTKTAQFSVATEYVYKDNSGSAIIDTTWFNCRAFSGAGIADLTNLRRGAKVHLVGRFRTRNYQSTDGGTHTIYEAIANTLEILED